MQRTVGQKAKGSLFFEILYTANNMAFDRQPENQLLYPAKYLSNTFFICHSPILQGTTRCIWQKSVRGASMKILNWFLTIIAQSSHSAFHLGQIGA